LDEALAKLIIEEIKRNAEAGGPGEYFFSYDDACPEDPLAAAEVLKLKDGSRYIAYLTCHPEHLGRGHGSALLRKILSRYPGNLVLTHPSSCTVPFYEKHGFKRLENSVFGKKSAA
jgi:GNAT superfamily N-acetyltransferase